MRTRRAVDARASSLNHLRGRAASGAAGRRDVQFSYCGVRARKRDRFRVRSAYHDGRATYRAEHSYDQCAHLRVRASPAMGRSARASPRDAASCTAAGYRHAERRHLRMREGQDFA